MTAVVIVDDHELLAESLRIALRASGVDARCVTPGEQPDVLAAVLAHAPRVVLLDLDLGRHGDALPMIAPMDTAGVRVVVVTGSTDRLRIATALEHGAVGFRSKVDGFDALLRTTAAALAGIGPLDADTRVALLDELRRTRAEQAAVLAPFSRLTDRERDTLRAIAQGLSVHDIASEWVVSDATVRSHVRGVLAKLDVRSQLGAVAAALRTGWLDGAGELTRK